MDFAVFKSYDGGKHWERAQQCPDFVSAAGTAQWLRGQHPSLRFRVDVDLEAASKSRPKGGRPTRRPR